MRSASGRGRSSVRQYLALLVLANLAVVLVVGIVGIAVVVRSHRAVHYLTEKVEPAGQLSAAAMQDLTDAETYVWGYGISGDPELRAKYAGATERFEARRTKLENLTSLDGQLGLLVADFLLATDNWFDAYADPRVAGEVGPDTFDAGRFDRGLRLFDEVRTTNAAVSDRLGEMSADAEADAESLSHEIVLLLVAVLVMAAAVSSLVGRRISRRVTAPLGELGDTAHRLAVGEHDARAPVTGPREVVQVAKAINRMADENDRAREVEARVVEQLRALDSVKSDFVSNVSHELRTPLTGILGYLELLEEEVRDHASDAELAMIGATKRNVVRLGELIDDLLALTHSEGRSTDLVPLDLALLTRDIVTDLRVASSQQGVDIRLGLPGTPVPVQADSSQIARVITNLVSNAVKFSQGASEVVVTVVADDEEAVLTVEDHGIGIPAEEMDQLGSRFYRASNAVSMGITGTGLGLRIVQAIMENHHGSIDMRSTQGVGTTVWVRIPLDVGPTAGLPIDSSLEQGSRPDPALG
jgi:two-component system OmpR family sensor kinase